MNGLQKENERRLSAGYQNAVGDLVSNEVGHCVSYLISHFARNMAALENSDYHYDDLLEVCADYRCHECDGNGATGWRVEFQCGNQDEDGEGCDHDWHVDYATEEEADEAAERENALCPECNAHPMLPELRVSSASEPEAIDCDYCDDGQLDDPVEALEHWIVSGWLAGELKARGEMVTEDFMGLPIWGRTCSGQAILLDGVICAIYDELHAGDVK